MNDFENHSVKAVENIELLEQLNSRYSTALEAVRQENEILSEVLVPNLTAACQHNLERWRAETALQVKRQGIMPVENRE